MLYEIQTLKPVLVSFTSELFPELPNPITVYVNEYAPVDGADIVDKLMDTGDVPEDAKMFEFIVPEEYTSFKAYVKE